jgi:hypothetical protein
MLTLDQIITHLQDPKYAVAGQKSYKSAESKAFLISNWRLKRQNGHFIYEVNTYANPHSNQLQGAEIVNQYQLMLTERELAKLYQDGKERYFYDAQVKSAA